ncbi:serpin family protein [Clostridium sp. YIM B02515]|uniref:Serpin family protein n=1 Tax=Clostridium rhizosphaerae TaxID=2803861 RepID=A0ABS1T8F7_9CLOT|nr:serpin family protein [Clostridium rhizosphaerae]MBL4935605.1 serpin family protein [Clostridium rhizosphaerae]
MRKLAALVSVFMLFSGIAGCGRAKTTNTTDISSKPDTTDTAQKYSVAENPMYPKSMAFDDYDGRISVMKDNKLEDSFSNALKDFTYKSTSEILKNKTNNITYSPVSLYMALSLAGTGAGGSTQKEIFSVLGAENNKADYISNENSKLFRLLYSDNEIGKIKIANSVWLDKDKKFKKSFLDTAVKDFYSSVYNLDFEDKTSSKLMEDWISKNTNGVISPKISLDKNQIMSILNTIYYKDQWMDKFDDKATKTDTFYLKNGQELKCDFMNSTYATHSFTRGEGFTSSALSLKNNGSLLFILPDKGVSIDSLLQSPEKAAKLFDEQSNVNGKVIFQIPKFSYGSSLDLKEALNNLGIKEAFKDNADFSGITEGKAFISNIKQESHIAIDEKGVEAAAFTQIDYAGSAAPKPEKAEMILNRPFIFAIKVNRDNILFVGIVNNPKEK